MTLQIEFWQLLGLLLSGLGVFWGVVKHSLGQSQHHLDERFTLQDAAREANHKALATRLDGMEQINRDEAAQWQRIERDLLKMQAEMPLHYVRREDYIRGQSVIEAKLDALGSKLEAAQLRAAAGGHHASN
ncbi:hypothetical protein [Simplicispira psychrophila]|uniref:hypothetical protein n=1 Tax=Simplicispira psychrophila TaxID=80882 RepID=UPI00047FE626|nr:hypothetical protein [Simplicispira psychrophila]